ncbi:hypothetical protein GMRT_11722 [Giardia muris]|uniref:Uncharacterized protein n=1 Tax=Giardia muris TaxID=5742 RepID=A0A4Z1T2T4_GIAMU|nr:hypothetical protein GMRT_11722 [Giardia muris]|eukprot:TNJ26731.1 hypothetical protein GMRT_11722 [Giardia muris]
MNDKEVCQLLLHATQGHLPLSQKHVIGGGPITERRARERMERLNDILKNLDLKAVRFKSRSTYSVSLVDASQNPVELRRQLWTRYPDVAKRGGTCRGAYIIVRCLIAIHDFSIPLGCLLEELQSHIPFPNEGFIVPKDPYELKSWKDFVDYCISSGWLQIQSNEDLSILATGDLAQELIQEETLIEYLYRRIGNNDDFDTFRRTRLDRFKMIRAKSLDKQSSS